MNRITFKFYRRHVILILFCFVGLPVFSQPCWAECGASKASTPVTLTDETSNLPNSRQLVDGTGTTIDTSTPGVVKINAISVPSVVSQDASVPSAVTNLQSAATGNGNGTVFDITGYATVILSVQGSLGGGSTVNFEVSADAGTTWTSLTGLNVGTTNTGTSTTSTGDWTFNTAGYGKMRARISSYGTGTISVKGVASVLAGSGGGAGGGGGGSVTSNLTQINGTTVSQGNGAAGSGTPRVCIASDNTAFSTIISGTAKGTTSAAGATVSSIDANHSAVDVYVRGGGNGGSTTISPATTATYMSSDALFTPAASATDIWTMAGSSTKTVKVLQLSIAYTGNGAGAGTFFLLRRSSSNTGGTSSSTTPGKMDVNDGASTCTIKTYTANPSSLGTTAAQLACFTMTPVAQTSSGIFAYTQANTDVQIFNYSIIGQPLILRGTSDILTLNCNGTSPTGGTVKVSVRAVFTEE